MPKIWAKVITVTVLTLFMSTALTWAIAETFRSTETALMLATATFCSLIIAPLLSYVFFRQGAEVNRLVKQLNEAHAQLQAAYLRVEEQARLDGLTGLLNRTTFVATAERMIASNSRGVLLILDIDHFKLINDTYGHSAGDAALFATAACISATLNENAVIGRLGGEEFGVLLPGFSPQQGYDQAEIVRVAVYQKVKAPESAAGALTISIGCAHFGDAPFQKSFEDADASLYRAKRSGRNRTSSYWRAA